ncbi:nuclease-related domain-containing DEAD/DEAH box helicase [Kaistia granuli]|uniref:nuclease-related domain-containing DEAD/DEAH box helicase n=1 Tax=Kaistia granuli TaxID=363259 RepID=UPI000367480E|nr:NERD domain-containing protein [Kaistia granuli]
MSGAQMWPAILPRQVRDNPLREAEVKVYDLLAEQLGPEWTVFYSRPWLGLTPAGVEKDGEADFVVVHAVRGYLTIEVKGGAIAFDPAADQWTSTDRYGIKHNIKNPVRQAVSAQHELLKAVKNSPSWPNRFIRARHGVVFTDSLPPAEALGPDMPREMFCCRPELKTISDWVRHRLSTGDEQPMGEAGVQAFRDVLARPFELSVPMGHYLDDDDQAIAELTPQQYHILTAVQDAPRMAAGGGAGTGKTILAIEDAARKAAAGHRTALVCLSPPLAQHLTQRLLNTGVYVWDLDRLCRSLASEAGILIPTGPLDPDQIATLICRSAEKRPDLRYDAIVVDEGQDIRSTCWVAFEDLLNSREKSCLHVFFDTNQSVYGDVSGELASFQIAPIRLTRNLRNTRTIHDAASKFYEGTELLADGPAGTTVEWIETTARNVDLKVLEVVRRLTGDDEVNPENIVVLCASDVMIDTLAKKLAAFDDISIEKVRDFKGLEKPVVILAATRDLSDINELAYVALSRPRVHLVVAGEPEMLSWLRQAEA